jgi:hypothetical protein
MLLGGQQPGLLVDPRQLFRPQALDYSGQVSAQLCAGSACTIHLSEVAVSEVLWRVQRLSFFSA